MTNKAGRTTIGGYSDGGAAAAFMAMKRPDLFGNRALTVRLFWEGHPVVKWEFLATQYSQTGKLPIHFFVQAGLLEGVAKDGPSLLLANRDFIVVLRKKNYEVTYQEVGGTHEPVHWRDTLPDGLILLSKDFKLRFFLSLPGVIAIMRFLFATKSSSQNIPFSLGESFEIGCPKSQSSAMQSCSNRKMWTTAIFEAFGSCGVTRE